MRLKTVTLKNFRCFESLTLDLHPQLTVIVGNNGAGKTALLDGIATALTPVLTHLSSANQRLRQSGRGFKDADFRIESYSGRGGKTLWAKADFAQVMVETYDELRWDYWKPSGITKGVEPPEKWGETQLKDRLSAIYASYKTTHPLLFPIFAYYGVGDIKVPERLRDAKLNYEHPTAALYDCLDPGSDFREMLEWFDLEESSELRENKGQVDEEFTPFDSLSAVRAAVVGLLGQYSNPHFNSKHKFMLTSQTDGAPMLVEQISQGYKRMLSIAMDFARRLAIANPQLAHSDDYATELVQQALDQLRPLGVMPDAPFGEALSMSAPAIMLVDEIDLHLHPSWQQRVLQDLMRTFPLTQFIVTTHSPQVLSTIRRENIRVLSDSSAEMPLASTYGQHSGDVMHSVMLVDPQPPIEEKQKIDRLTALVDQGLWGEAEARSLLQQLAQTLGPENARLQQLRRSIQRQEALAGLSKQ